MTLTLRPHRIIPLLFFFSGFVALVLEVVWARRLSFIFGQGVKAAGAVVAMTLIGLALGSRWGGPRADRTARPLLGYAALEGGITLWALLTPLLFRALPRLTASLPDPLGGGLDLDPASFIATSLLLLPGTLLMGATTPFMVKALSRLSPPRPAGDSRDLASCGESLGWLYGWNTLGGASGAMVATFVMLPLLGMGRTLWVAAALGGLVAFIAATLDGAVRRSYRDSQKPAPIPEVSTIPSGGRRVVLLLLFLAGTAGALCQIAWTRSLVLLFGSSVHAFGLALSVYLTGMALGSLASSRLLRRTAAAPLAASWLLVALTSSLLSLPVWGKTPVLISWAWMRVGPSFAGAIGIQLVASFLLLLLPAAALGALLPTLTTLLGGGAERYGRDSGDGYSLDTWGSVVGILVATYLLLPALGSETILRGAILLEALLLIPVGWWAASPRRFPVRFALGCVWVLLAATGALWLPRWDPALMTSGPLLYGRSYAARSRAGPQEIEAAIHRRGRLRFVEEGPESTVTVREGAGGILSLQINGKTDASTGGDLPTQLMAGHLPALLHPAPQSALVIGLASGITAGALALHPIERIDCVELSPGVTRAALFFARANRGVLADPRLRLLQGDGRALLARRPVRYDLITSQPTNPWIAGVTNLFTREFFLLARNRLNPGGVLSVWVQGYALEPGDFRSIAGTFLEVFPNAQIWEESAAGGDYFLLGKSQGTWPGADELVDRLNASESLRTDLGRAGIESVADLLSRFLAGPQGLSALTRDAAIVTDDNLRLEYSAPRSLWGASEAELISGLEQVRQSPLAFFPLPATPRGSLLQGRLSQLEARRRDRIRLALSLRRPDWEALASPDLATAVSLAGAGLFDAALPFLRRARVETPEAPAVPLLMGWLLLEGGDLEAASEAFGQALSLNPESADAANGGGLAAWRRGGLVQAELFFRRAYRLAPEDPDPASNLASVLIASGREAEALKILEEVVRDHPRHVPARINRGVALARLGRYEEAVSDYLQALTLDPRNRDAAYNLRRARERAARDGRSLP